MFNILDRHLLKRKIIHFFIIVVFLLISILIVIQYIENLAFYEFAKPYFGKVSSIINHSIISFGNVNLSILSMISFSFILFVGFTIGKFYKKGVYSIKRKNKTVSHGTITILANIGYYIIITVVLLVSLKAIGIDLSSLTMIISALSVGIGFGLQTIVSNFISGIILMFEQSIKEGDFIEVGDNLKGTVVNINMRSTTIRTNNNIIIVVPNQSFIENNIINWTLNDNVVRLQIPFGVAYGTTFEKVEEVILGSLETSGIDYIKTKKPAIVMTGMGNSSVDFSLYVWVEGDDTNIPLVTKGKFLRMVYKALNENNISIPFPQTDLHIRDSVPLEVRIKQ